MGEKEASQVGSKDGVLRAIAGIIESRPHLRDVAILYEKAVEFDKIVKTMLKAFPVRGAAYPAELIEPVFEHFSLIFDLPSDSLEPLKDAMVLGRIDFSLLPLNEVPAFSLPYHEEELMTMLFLMSRPYFLRLRELFKGNDNFGEDGRCPVCKSTPSTASIGEDNKKRLYCSFCGLDGYYKRLSCPACLNQDASAFNIITADEEKGFRVDACDACMSYIKTANAGIINELGPDLADIVSLPLDVIAQGRGYRRNSPNPVGISMMV
jgi:FdhE protein